MKGIWGVVLWVLLILVLFVLLISYLIFQYSIKRKGLQIKRKKPKDSKDPYVELRSVMEEGKSWIRAQNMEKLEMNSYDGLRLVGYLLPAKQPTNRVVLMMHGYRSPDFNDFTSSAKYFHELGYNILLADQRSHGESEGKYICFGVKERYDCRDWVHSLVERYGQESSIFLMGVSMGCATVLMSLGLKLPKQVKGCIADCGFTSAKDMFHHILRKDFHMPNFPFLWLQGLYCRIIAGFDMGYSTLDALRRNKTPVLFVHGGKDTFVPIWMTQRNFEACRAPKELLIIQEAEHAMSFMRAPERCWKAMKAFVEKYQ